nr:RecName: Full=Ribosome-inactivating protein luffacylin; AltName: Full=rRNA N-glycosidase [Luffa aegyptiaca]
PRGSPRTEYEAARR